MHLVRIGTLTVSLEYLILSEDPPGLSPDSDVCRFTLEAGRVVDFNGEEASLARLFVDQVAIKQPGARAAVRGREVGGNDAPPASALPFVEGEQGRIGIRDNIRDGDETKPRPASAATLA
jgi:hypothetical protein